MTPSPRSHPNHPQQPVSPPYTRNVRGNGCGSCHWLRHSLAGSPLLQTESGSLLFGTAGPPRAAPHPVSRRRSCLRLLSRCSSRDDSDFHWLISYMCVRTSGVSMSAGGGLRFGSHRQPLQTRAAARNPWRVDLRLDPFFSREAASQGGIAVSAVQAHGMVCSSVCLPRRQKEMGHAGGCPSRRIKRAAARLLWQRLYERRRGGLRFGSHRQALQTSAAAITANSVSAFQLADELRHSLHGDFDLRKGGCEAAAHMALPSCAEGGTRHDGDFFFLQQSHAEVAA